VLRASAAPTFRAASGVTRARQSDSPGDELARRVDQHPRLRLRRPLLRPRHPRLRRLRLRCRALHLRSPLRRLRMLSP